jgi:exodeoxyribonuclease-3
MLTIATWNVNSLRVRLAQVLDWLATHQPHVLALQETKLSDPEFPGEALAMAGYQVAFAGQKTYNGVAVLAREPLADVVTDLPGLEDPQRRVLGATIGGVRVLNLYVPNGQSVDSDKYRYKLDWLDRLCGFVGEELQRYPELVVLGDFNIAPEDRDVHDPMAWAGKVLCSEPERAAFRRLLESGLVDTFRRFEQPENTFSWWDYRAAGFRRNHGLRIDHVLASRQLAERCRSCEVDRAPRKLERPSDHAPVVAVFD